MIQAHELQQLKERTAEMSEGVGELLGQEAAALLAKMTEDEVEGICRVDGEWLPYRLAKVLLIVAAEKIESEIGYETMGKAKRIVKRASKR